MQVPQFNCVLHIQYSLNFLQVNFFFFPLTSRQKIALALGKVFNLPAFYSEKSTTKRKCCSIKIGKFLKKWSAFTEFFGVINIVSIHWTFFSPKPVFFSMLSTSPWQLIKVKTYLKSLTRRFSLLKSSTFIGFLSKSVCFSSWKLVAFLFREKGFCSVYCTLYLLGWDFSRLGELWRDCYFILVGNWRERENERRRVETRLSILRVYLCMCSIVIYASLLTGIYSKRGVGRAIIFYTTNPKAVIKANWET